MGTYKRLPYVLVSLGVAKAAYSCLMKTQGGEATNKNNTLNLVLIEANPRFGHRDLWVWQPDQRFWSSI